MNRTTPTLRLGFLIVAAWFISSAAPAGAFTFTDCNGFQCEWGKYPVPFYVRNPLGATFEDEDAALSEIEASFHRWEYKRQTFCKPLEFTYAGRAKTADPAVYDQKNLVYFENELWLYGSDALAITTCWYDQTGEMKDCDIAINAVSHHWSIDGAPGTYSIRSTLTHEVGHFWGLDHSSIMWATMYAYYNANNKPEDLDGDDIKAAAVRYCTGEMPADDLEEPNDSFGSAKFLLDRTELNDLRLYDDDWWRIDLQQGRRIKITAQDDRSDRAKYFELYEENGELVDREFCLGDCAQALGEAGAARAVYLRVDGDFDNRHITDELYNLLIEQILPGEEGDLHDDDVPVDDDTEEKEKDHTRGCRFSGVTSGDPPSGGGIGWLLALGGLLVLIAFLRRPVRQGVKHGHLPQ